MKSATKYNCAFLTSLDLPTLIKSSLPFLNTGCTSRNAIETFLLAASVVEETAVLSAWWTTLIDGFSAI